jgi:uncharacterized SAM-binding protein YcdF (DUF218 family)
MAERRKWVIALSLTALAVTIYFVLPFALNAAARSLIRADTLYNSDVVIALGGDARCLRERSAADFYHKGLATHVIVSGVPYGWGIHTGEAAKRYVLSLGVPADKVTVLLDSWNTRREAIQVARLMQENGWRSAILVTSPFHSRRATYTLERYAPGFRFASAPLPAEPPEWQPDRWWSRRGDMGFTVREFLSWGNTVVGGLQ